MTNILLDILPTWVGNIIQGDFSNEKQGGHIESAVLMGAPRDAIQPASFSGKFEYSFKLGEVSSAKSSSTLSTGQNFTNQQIKRLSGFSGIIIKIEKFDDTKIKTYDFPILRGNFGWVKFLGQNSSLFSDNSIEFKEQIIMNPDVLKLGWRSGLHRRPKESATYQISQYCLQKIEGTLTDGVFASISFIPVWEVYSISYQKKSGTNCGELRTQMMTAWINGLSKITVEGKEYPILQPGLNPQTNKTWTSTDTTYWKNNDSTTWTLCSWDLVCSSDDATDEVPQWKEVCNPYVSPSGDS
jgi:hypothetical protein